MREWIIKFLTWLITTRSTTASSRELLKNNIIMRRKMLAAGLDHQLIKLVTLEKFSTNRDSVWLGAPLLPMHQPTSELLKPNRFGRYSISRSQEYRPTLSMSISSSMSYKLKFLTLCTVKEMSANFVINSTIFKINTKTSKWTWREWNMKPGLELRTTVLKLIDSLGSWTNLNMKMSLVRKSKWDCSNK